MKIYYLLVLLFLMANDCRAQQEITPLKITYKASSRGLYQDIELTKNTVSVRKERSSPERTEISMPEGEWVALINLCQALPESVQAFDTNRLEVDAAITGVLTLKKSNDSADDAIFVLDHSDVVEDLQPLMRKIRALNLMIE